MKNVVDWMDEHPNYSSSTILHREYIERNGTRIEKARELDWEDFKSSISFVNSFKKENRISSRKYTKLITRNLSKKTPCSLTSIGPRVNLRDYLIQNIPSFYELTTGSKLIYA